MKKKILFILSSSSPYGGSTKSIQAVLEQLYLSHDYDFGVVLPTKSGVYYDWLKRGWTVHHISVRHANCPPHQRVGEIVLFPLRWILHNWINYQAYCEIKKLIKEYNYDMVHTNVGVLNVGFKAAMACGIPHVYHIREYQDLDFGENIYPSHLEFNRILKSSGNYSVAITKDLFNYFDCDVRRASVIYNGVISLRDKIDWNKEKYFLFVGRLSRSKGVEDVINAFHKIHLQFTDYKLILAGAPISHKYGIYLYQLVQKLGIEKNVDFIGAVDYCDELMKKATCLIMASQSEGLGRVTIEAMSVGCLVIGYNNKGTKEQFDNGLAICGSEIGLRYEVFEELVVHMANVARKGVMNYENMIINAQDVVFQLYTKENCYSAMVNVYKKLFNENNQ